MKRRDFIHRVSIATGVTLVGITVSTLCEAVASDGKADWGYTGNEGPENWGRLSGEYQVCQTGTQQSPIDLEQAVESDFSTFNIEYSDIPLKILNNGHTIQVNAEPGSMLMLNDTAFELQQLHFHTPSEHTVKDETFPMEVHFVHQSAEGKLAVLGVFLKEGQFNRDLQPIWDAMPARKQSETLVKGVGVAIATLLPKVQSTYRYFGSLTTPPCSEVVQWVVFQEALEISQAQIDQFRQIFPLNARPVQPLNRQFLPKEVF
ncbi:MAG: carbonic anhydrase family protein [Cyanobacteria bacterium P01_A01_bin.17]